MVQRDPTRNGRSRAVHPWECERANAFECNSRVLTLYRVYDCSWSSYEKLENHRRERVRVSCMCGTQTQVLMPLRMVPGSVVFL